MRGLYTAGVLDYFLDNALTFDYSIGVSAGVCHGISFVSGQRGRTRRINLDYCGDKRYLSLQNFIKTGSVFGMDFVFDEIPTRLDVFDYSAFCASKTEFVIGVTDVETGKPLYFSKRDTCVGDTPAHLNRAARASSAIPVFSGIVEIDGKQYLDGGTSDPIPINKALADGCDRLVVVLTRDRGFVRQPEKFRRVYRRLYRRFPQMVQCLDRRYQVYNSSLEQLRQLEQEGRAFVLAPHQPVTLGRFEHSREALDALYRKGYEETQAAAEKLRTFLASKVQAE